MKTDKKPKLSQIPIECLQRGKYQPRVQFDQESLQELSQSIRSAGLLQPIVVRPLGTTDQPDHYEIVAGERRWRASQLAGLEKVNCLVNEYTDEQAAEVAAIENVNRVDLNPIEEAEAYQRLIDEFAYLHDEVAAAVGKSRVKITNILRLLRLDQKTQALLKDGRLTEGHGKVLAGLEKSQQYPMAKRALARNWSVRKLEQEVKALQKDSIQIQNQRDPNLTALERKASEYLGSKVRIDFAQTRGQMVVDFQNIDILQGILEKIGLEEEVG